jgi:uncharacterized protein YhbP (UPF0306 family)
MGKMKQISEIIRNNDVDSLRRLINISLKANRETVFFIGRTYSIDDANKILLYMYDEQAKHNKVHRDNKPVESDLNSND